MSLSLIYEHIKVLFKQGCAWETFEMRIILVYYRRLIINVSLP